MARYIRICQLSTGVIFIHNITMCRELILVALKIETNPLKAKTNPFYTDYDMFEFLFV